MRHVHGKTCRKWCVRCWLAFATVNNTPLGFLFEHAFWDRVPVVRLVPALLGIH